MHLLLEQALDDAGAREPEGPLKVAAVSCPMAFYTAASQGHQR